MEKILGERGNVVGYSQTWYYGGEWAGIKVDDEERVDRIDSIGKAKGIRWRKNNPYVLNHEKRIFDMSTYLLLGSMITYGKKKAKVNSNLAEIVPYKITRVVAEKESKIEEIARLFKLPLNK